MRVIGTPKGRVISIPEGIEQFDTVLKTISSLCPVRVRTIEQWQKYRAFMAAGLILFVILLWATSPLVVIPTSLAIGSVVVWVFFWLRRNPSIPDSTKRVAWIYGVFLVVCVVKLLVAVAGVEKGSVTLGKIIATIFVFSPCVLLAFGWARWFASAIPRDWRNYAVASGLAAASISGLCLYGVLSYVQLAHIGTSNEHRLAMAGA